MTAQLFNIFDTLCGWCFVAHNETRKLVDDLPDDIAVQHLHRKLFVGPHEMDINDGMIAMVRRVGQEIAPQKKMARGYRMPISIFLAVLERATTQS
jgi:protein-disulfide isomerase-like protein with CxxC motif